MAQRRRRKVGARKITIHHGATLSTPPAPGDDGDMDRPTRKINLTVPVGVYEAIEAAARRNGLRVAEMTREFLRESPSLYEQARRMDGAR